MAIMTKNDGDVLFAKDINAMVRTFTIHIPLHMVDGTERFKRKFWVDDILDILKAKLFLYFETNQLLIQNHSHGKHKHRVLAYDTYSSLETGEGGIWRDNLIEKTTIGEGPTAVLPSTSFSATLKINDNVILNSITDDLLDQDITNDLLQNSLNTIAITSNNPVWVYGEIRFRCEV